MQHSFYIPVMGTGFTIDTPLAVAKYGVSSVIPLVDDVLIEKMRKLYCHKFHKPYTAITSEQEDFRAERITAYLNLVQEIVNEQVAKLKALTFTPGNELCTYFDMLPDGALKKGYQEMLLETDLAKKEQLQKILLQAIVPGGIDVNIMTKLDRANMRQGKTLPYQFNDAAAALRGFAHSNLHSTIIFSAGFNPHLFGYLSQFKDFIPDANNRLKKKICLKVSDYRSAAIQGKYLAKRGLWVSEYRVESPLNCGGHAFINDGQLLGPILEEFRQNKTELVQTLHEFYSTSLKNLNIPYSEVPQPIRITAQGGIGTNKEHDFLINYYELDGAGWASPFLLVPEVTNVDAATLAKLLAANETDIFLSNSSPLGVPFWNLRNSGSEEARIERIKNNNPGSRCTKGYAKIFSTDDGKPICTASREYQMAKLSELDQSNISDTQKTALRDNILSKSCICTDLAGCVEIKNLIDPNATPAICPGPNLLNFKKISTLKEMINHIYGRCSLLINKDRQHMFIREAQLQINYLLNEIKNASLGLPTRSQQKINEVKQNLLEGIEYYQNLAQEVLQDQKEKFLNALQTLRQEIENIQTSIATQST